MYHLDIPKTRQYDTGKVEVIARNAVGEAIATTELKVVPRSDDYRGVLKNAPRRKLFKNQCIFKLLFAYTRKILHFNFFYNMPFLFTLILISANLFKQNTKKYFLHFFNIETQTIYFLNSYSCLYTSNSLLFAAIVYKFIKKKKIDTIDAANVMAS